MRLLRWADRLHQYKFDLVYRTGKENNVADLLSRATTTCSDSPVSIIESETDEIISTIFGSPALRAISQSDLEAATRDDSILQQVFDYITNGWPKKRPIDSDLHSFIQIQDELSISRGCIYRGNRAVIPKFLQNQIIQLAPEGHSGIFRTK